MTYKLTDEQINRFAIMAVEQDFSQAAVGSLLNALTALDPSLDRIAFRELVAFLRHHEAAHAAARSRHLFNVAVDHTINDALRASGIDVPHDDDN